MSTEVKQDIEQEVSQKVVQETEVMGEIETENVYVESTPEVDIEAVKKALEAREAELAKWQKELAEKASQLEAESVRIHQKNVALDEREKTIEEGLKLKINAEYAEAKSRLSEEQAKSRADFVAELDGKRGEFEKRRQKAIAALDKELEGVRTEAKKELDALKKAREDSEKKWEEFVENKNKQKAALDRLKQKSQQSASPLSFMYGETPTSLPNTQKNLEKATHNIGIVCEPLGKSKLRTDEILSLRY